MKKPLLSIAIATKNREKYCIASIQSILNYNNDLLEIVVADNSATNEIQKFVKATNSPQIKYVYDNSEIPFIENFNRAVNMTTGEYVIMIGDDDSILPFAFEMAVWAKENGADTISSKQPVEYYWPEARDIYPTGYLSIPIQEKGMIKIDVQKQLDKVVKNGMQLYLLYNLPMTYHGIVRKEILNEIKAKTGHFYGGLTPDIYSCVALSCLVKNHYVVNQPISIAGVCPSSGSAQNIKGGHSGSFEDIPHLKNKPDYIWNALVPRYYSVNTIWAESALRALTELNQTELIKKFNPYILIAQATINNRKFIPEIMSVEHENYRVLHHISKLEYAFNLLKAYSTIVKNKLSFLYKQKTTNTKFFNKHGVADIQQVVDIYNTI